jgi:hypothetical protein
MSENRKLIIAQISEDPDTYGGDEEQNRHTPLSFQPSSGSISTHTVEAVDLEFKIVSRASGSRELYLPLDPDFTAQLAWTNDPRNLSIETYFDPDKEVNLRRKFNIKGLWLVLREDDDPDNFILTYGEQRWYLFDESDGMLLWVKNKDLETLTSKEEQADFILCGYGYLETEVVYLGSHPANKPGTRESKEEAARCSV